VNTTALDEIVEGRGVALVDVFPERVQLAGPRAGEKPVPHVDPRGQDRLGLDGRSQHWSPFQ
jgi:hypothetical protein